MQKFLYLCGLNRKHFPNTVGTIQITIKEIEQQKAIYMLQQGE